MHPLLFDVLQKQSFASKMKFCFPRSKNCSTEADAALSLIKTCLNVDPKKRIAAKAALNHKLFGGEVFYELEESSPWDSKLNFEQIERLIRGSKVRHAVTVGNTDAEQCVLVLKNW